MIAIIDYKASNIASLVAALKRLGYDSVVTNNPAVITTADKVIFPGQGRTAPAMAELKRTGLDKLLPELKQSFLGICLGMQLLFEHSEEDNCDGLGIIPGQVVRFQTTAPVPQVGWNQGYYFVHSYYVTTAPRYVLNRANYGGQWFASMVAKDNFFGVQFHPEKSGAAGLKLLKQFCETGKIQPTQIIPAIDLLNGQCVRLQQGDYNQVTRYSIDPLATAKQFEQQGAAWLHVVDLDGAKVGRPVSQDIIKKIVGQSGLRIEVGGGIRSLKTAIEYLEMGVDRIVLGTAGIQQPELLDQLIKHYGVERIVVGLDIKSDQIATEGWTVTSGMSLEQTLSTLAHVKNIIVTDISKDGMMSGPNFALCQQVSDQGFDVIVSGGVSSEADLVKAEQLGFAGVITGKALYEGKINLQRPGFTKRLIACLDIANGSVVKGAHFTDLTDQGDPVELAKRYETQGADEIVLLDIMATVENRDTLYSLVTRVAETLSVPFCVGGGVCTVEDIRALLLAGADKVSIGSAALKYPELVQQASAQFGAQCIVVSVDPKWNGQFWEVFIKGGREATGVNAVDFAKQMEQAGAGELLVNSLDRDGTKQGYDLKLLQAICNVATIPVIASSGVGTIQHIKDVFTETTVSAALVAGVLHSGELTINQIKQTL